MISFCCCFCSQALKILRTAEFAPFVVFIAAPKNISLMDVRCSKDRSDDDYCDDYDDDRIDLRSD